MPRIQKYEEKFDTLTELSETLAHLLSTLQSVQRNGDVYIEIDTRELDIFVEAPQALDIQ